MSEEVEVPEEDFESDCIDDALMDLIDLYDDEEDEDAPYDKLMDIIADMIDAKEIGEIPDAEDDDTVKMEWVEKSIPLILEKIK